MASTFLKTAQRELSVLEAKLDKNPDFARWKAVKATVDAYLHMEVEPAAASVPLPARQPAAPPPAAPPQSSTSKPILEAAERYLREKRCHVNSTVMADALVARGVEIGGNNKAATLSAHLSNAKGLFENVRGKGYGLVEWKVKTSRETETPDGSKPSGVPSHPEVAN